MTLRGQALPDGQLFMISDRLMLVDDVQAITVMGGAFDQEKWAPQVHLTLQGRRNKSEERDDITVALNKEGMDAILHVLLHNLAVLERAEQEAGGN